MSTLAVIELGIDPMLHLGPVTVAWHGLTITIGIVVGCLLAGAEARARGPEAEPLYTMGLILIAGAIVGSKLFYLVEHGQLTDANAWLATESSRSTAVSSRSRSR